MWVNLVYKQPALTWADWLSQGEVAFYFGLMVGARRRLLGALVCLQTIAWCLNNFRLDNSTISGFGNVRGWRGGYLVQPKFTPPLSLRALLSLSFTLSHPRLITRNRARFVHPLSQCHLTDLSHPLSLRHSHAISHTAALNPVHT